MFNPSFINIKHFTIIFLIVMSVSKKVTQTAAMVITTSSNTMTSASSTALSMNIMNSSHDSANSKPSIAIIGAGAAGLVTAKVLSSNGYQPFIFEKEENQQQQGSYGGGIGGVWSYQPNSKTKPMYKGLRTNLPRELMAFRTKKWGGDGKTMSFVTHTEVKQYLLDYSIENDLIKYISFGCNVKQLTVCSEDENKGEGTNDHWPKVEIEWEQSQLNQNYKQRFDGVCICNGHYSIPSFPNIPGIQHFKGRTMHSIEYDDPSVFQDLTVLCVGGRASGADLAREISTFAKKVFLSDTTCPILDDGLPLSLENVSWVPKTISIDEQDGRVHFEKPCIERPNDIDVIIFCSGYDYHFPFINKDSNLDFEVIPGERRVSPLYSGLWHAQYPNIAFIGLQHSVVPFPFFEFQAEAYTRQLSVRLNNNDDTLGMKVPSLLHERMEAAAKDKHSGGPKEVGRVQDSHYLGSFQWDACRKYAEYGNVLNEDVKKFIATNKVCFQCIQNMYKISVKYS